jgi:hypothetical protein
MATVPRRIAPIAIARLRIAIPAFCIENPAGEGEGSQGDLQGIDRWMPAADADRWT